MLSNKHVYSPKLGRKTKKERRNRYTQR